MTVSTTIQEKKSKPIWTQLVRPYQTPIVKASTWQIINTFIPFFALWYLMYRSLEIHYILTLLLAIPIAGFNVRMFIIQHDCGHGSFFNSRKANDRLGMICGVFTLTPYYQWRKSHAVHHASAGHLGRRDVHDVYTMTVNEYRQASTAKKLRYRLYRNPITLFLIIPMTLFVILYRFPALKSRRKEWMGVLLNDLILVIMVVTISYYIGLGTFLMLYLPVVFVATFVGTWLFYIQHQFEETYWADGDEWDYTSAALEGSSFYRLPKILQFFTGNIGFHHIHHLSPRIPNYKLESCHKDNPELQDVPTLTLSSSLRSSTLTLWDEEEKRLISFREFCRYSRANV